eukprot:scaffold16309_cov46-Attheya_sp.AAC.2
MQQLEPKTEEKVEPFLNSSLKDESKIMGGMASTQLSQNERWKMRYRELKEYQAEHGECLVPQKYPPNPALGLWVAYQRSGYSLWTKGKKGNSSITPERIKLLEQLGFVWDVSITSWNTQYHELEEYRAKHGDCLVPNKYPPNPALGLWVSKQRTEYSVWKSQKGKASITPERIRLLKQLGFVWDASLMPSTLSHDQQWNMRYQELEEYKAEHGNCLVPKRYPPNPALGYWVDTQRTSLFSLWENEMGNSYITPERIKRLEKLGFVWKVHYRQPTQRDEQKWQKRYEELKEYQSEHGDCLVPQKYTPNPALGTWVGKQRVKYSLWKNKNDKFYITPKRIELLERIGFVWNAREAILETKKRRMEKLS